MERYRTASAQPEVGVSPKMTTPPYTMQQKVETNIGMYIYTAMMQHCIV